MTLGELAELLRCEVNRTSSTRSPWRANDVPVTCAAPVHPGGRPELSCTSLTRFAASTITTVG